MIDMCFLLFSSFSSLDTGKALRKQSTSLFAGLERPHDSFGQPKAPKSGVAPAHPGVLPASKLIVAPRATSTFLITSIHPQGERNGERDGDHCLSRTVHRFPSQNRVATDEFSPGRCQTKRFAPATAVRTPPAAPAR